MKNEPNQPGRRAPGNHPRRRQSSAAAILKTEPRSEDRRSRINWSDYPGMLLFATLAVFTFIAFFFTPYTHQLDDIKNTLLWGLAPFLLVAAFLLKDFTTMSWRTHASTFLLGLYLVQVLFSWTINDYKLINERVVWFHLACATFTIVFAWFINSESKLRKTMIYFSLLGLASTLLGLFMYAGQGFTEVIYEYMSKSPWWNKPGRSNWITLFYTLAKSRNDMYSFILNPDFYAAFLVMTIPIPLSMFFVEQRILYKTIAVAAFLLMNICLVFTNSNDSYWSMIPLYIIYAVLAAWYVREWGISKQFLVSFFGGVFVLFISVVALMWPIVAATWDFKSAAYEGRVVLWSGGFWPWIYGKDFTRSDIDLLAILFGVGPGGYRYYFSWFRRPDYFDQQINNVTTFGHNWYLDVLLETGAIGLILFMAFHIRVIVDALRQVRTTESRTHLFYQIALIAGLAGIAVQNFSSPNNRWAVAGMTYWALFGLSMGLHHLENPGTPRPPAAFPKLAGWPVPRVMRVAALGIACLFLLRSGFMQALPYWWGSKANAEGLKYMDYAQSPYVAETEQETYLALAMKKFEEAIDHNPTFVTSYYKLGNIYNSMGYTDKAIETYERLNEINPSYSELHLNLGIMYYIKAESLQEGVDAARELAAEKEKEAATSTGTRKQELLEEAATLRENARTVDENLDELKLAFYEKSYDALKEAARQSLKPNVQSYASDIGYALVQLYEQSGQAEKASKLREEIKEYNRNIITYEPKIDDVVLERRSKYPKAQRMLIQLAEETGKLEEAEEVLKTMVRENPDNDTYLRLLLAVYDRQNKTEAKLEFLQEAVHDDPTDARLRRTLAEAHLNAGKLKEYERELRRVEVLDPQNPTALSGLYVVYKEQNSPKAAEYREKLRKLQIDPEQVTTVIQEGATPPVLKAPQPAPADAPTTAPASDPISTTPVAAATEASTRSAASAAPPPLSQVATTPTAAVTTTVVTGAKTAASTAQTAPTPVTNPVTAPADRPTTAPGPDDVTTAPTL